MKANYISFDLENWYDSEFVHDKNQKEDLVVDGLNKVLCVLKKHDVKATFFVTGRVAERYPGCLKEIFSQGHEIASHGYSHQMLTKLTKKKIIYEIKKSKEAIKKITNKSPIGFRAPCWSITQDKFYIYQILKKEGYKYSSSLFPLDAGLYGSSKFPMNPFYPLKDKKFLEIPIRHYSLGKIRIPFSGGFYFRLLPKFMLYYFFRRLEKLNRKVVLYLHPWEFCNDIPKVKIGLLGKFITYYGISENLDKLDYILNKFKFVPLKEALKND